MNISILKYIRNRFLIVYTPLNGLTCNRRGHSVREGDDWSILDISENIIYQENITWDLIPVCLFHSFLDEKAYISYQEKRRKRYKIKEHRITFNQLIDLKGKQYAAF